MKKRFTTTIMICVLAAGISIWTGVSQTKGDDDPAKVYAAIIDDAIKKCQAKSVLLDSRSYHTRRIAVRASLKSTYFKAHKDELVAHLLANKVEFNKYIVQYHLNHIFYNKVRPMMFAQKLKSIGY